MEMTERVVGNVTVLDVSGKVTLSDGADKKLSDKLRSLVQQNRKQLVLNLGNVSYVDSAGLGAIVHSYATVKNQGGSLKLLNVTGKLRDLLSITKLLTVFDTYENEADAVKSF
jgi:anti-sigma B factor antagonist